MDQDIDEKSEFCTVIQRQKILYIRPIHLTHQNGQMTCTYNVLRWCHAIISTTLKQVINCFKSLQMTLLLLLNIIINNELL